MVPVKRAGAPTLPGILHCCARSAGCCSFVRHPLSTAIGVGVGGPSEVVSLSSAAGRDGRRLGNLAGYADVEPDDDFNWLAFEQNVA